MTKPGRGADKDSLSVEDLDQIVGGTVTKGSGGLSPAMEEKQKISGAAEPGAVKEEAQKRTSG